VLIVDCPSRTAPLPRPTHLLRCRAQRHQFLLCYHPPEERGRDPLDRRHTPWPSVLSNSSRTEPRSPPRAVPTPPRRTGRGALIRDGGRCRALRHRRGCCCPASRRCRRSADGIWSRRRRYRRRRCSDRNRGGGGRWCVGLWSVTDRADPVSTGSGYNSPTGKWVLCCSVQPKGHDGDSAVSRMVANLGPRAVAVPHQASPSQLSNFVASDLTTGWSRIPLRQLGSVDDPCSRRPGCRSFVRREGQEGRPAVEASRVSHHLLRFVLARRVFVLAVRLGGVLLLTDLNCSWQVRKVMTFAKLGVATGRWFSQYQNGM
jgi:hypothetical protein